eukprot:scaffold14007_cov142-Isochrysis_galbana.AAC.1
MNVRPRATRLLARSLHSALLALCLSTARAPALGMGCECSKDPFGSRSTPHYYHSKRLSTTTTSGVLSNFNRIPENSFITNHRAIGEDGIPSVERDQASHLGARKGPRCSATVHRQSAL